MTLVTLEVSFSCAHFYRQPAWDAKINHEKFGKCFSAHGHGHDYRLKVSADISKTDLLKKALQELREELDHKHLNFEIAEFKNKIPTTENIIVYCHQYLETKKLQLKRLELFETSGIFATLDDFIYFRMQQTP